MTTHRFFVTPTRVLGDLEVIFSDDQVHQMRHVLRLRAGDRVRVFNGLDPNDWLVELGETNHGRIIGACAQAVEPSTRLVAYPALVQRDKFESVLQKLTEVGVRTIVPVITARGLVREPPDERRCARWKAILSEAAEQCGRGRIPSLLPATSFEAAIAQADGRVLVAYERGPRDTLQEALADRPSTVSLFVGPEGGFAPEEASLAQRAGARLVTLGPRVLRTETASPFLAALVLYELGDLQ